MEHLTMHSVDGVTQNVERIAALFPNCVTERKGENGEVERAIDFDLLRQELSRDIIDSGEERYQFTWPGKREAIRLANAPTNCTLRPVRDDSVAFDSTQNLYIEGDNLEVLKLLRETYLGKVKMIYIDPPYNTGNDFVYEDDFAQSYADYKGKSGMFDENGNMLLDNYERNNESNGRFHTDWLNLMFPRLKVARDLLTDDGVLFISIDDAEIENLRKLSDEVFGQRNFIAQFVWKKKQGGGNDSAYVVAEHEYILCFAKNISAVSLNLDKKYKLDDALYPNHDEKGDYGLITLDKASIQFSQSLVYEIIGPDGTSYFPRIVKGKQSCWRWGKKKVEEQYNDLVFKNGKVYTKYYRPEGVTPRSLLIDAVYGRTESGNDDISALFEKNPFSYPKPVALIHHFASIGTSNQDLILDFFSGSGTTAHAVMQLNAEDGGNRKFIMVQLPEVTDEKSEARKAGYENICEIGKERIRRAGKKIKAEHPEAKDLDIGFRVLRLDSSNMEDVFYLPKDTVQADLFSSVDNVKPDRSSEDLLFQIMLELGIPLSSKIESEHIHGKEVYFVEQDFLIACFDEGINEDTITAIAKRKPQYFVLRDNSMATDNVADNFDQIFEAYSRDTIRRIL